MARTRGFDAHHTTGAAMQQFWEHGYAGTSLADLERCTGLNRSSIYQFYGSKRGLFDASVQVYLREVFTPRLAILSGRGAPLDRLAGYFGQFATAAAGVPDELMQRGCLVVNSATEMAGHNDAVRVIAGSYRSVLGAVITSTLTEVERIATPDVLRRSDMLVASVIGVLVTGRFDLSLARRTAEGVAAEVLSW